MNRLREYAIKKDTFRILVPFQPFPDMDVFFDMEEAEIIARGKVNLYLLNDYANPKRVSLYTGGGLIPALIDESMGNYTFMYVLEEPDTGYMRGIPGKKEKMLEVLQDFFPDAYVTKYFELKEKGKLKYRAVPELVELYNSRQ